MAAQGILVPLVSVRIAASQRNPCNLLNVKELDDFGEKNGTKTGQNLFLAVATLVEICKEKKMLFAQPIPGVDFTPARLVKGKVWYISFYVKAPETGKLRRVRIKVNREKDKRLRNKAAIAAVGDINFRLAAGWNPLLESVSPKAGTTAFAAVDAFLAAKTKEMRANSVRTYKSFTIVFKEWLSSHGFTDSTLISSFTDKMAASFMSDVDQRADISALTFNNYTRFFHGMFEWMVSSGYVIANPFQGIQKKPRRLTRGKKRRLLSDDEVSNLIVWLRTRNPEYLAMCLLCYCCFMRPKEIALLRCRDVDLANRVVRVRGEIAKNGNDSVRTIPDAMMPAFSCLDLSRPDYYIFGAHPGRKCFKPGLKPVLSQRIADYWRLEVRPGCGFGGDVQFYSLKDTGITNMLSSGIPINLVQQQADHSSVAMTAIYVGKKAGASTELRNADIIPLSQNSVHSARGQVLEAIQSENL